LRYFIDGTPNNATSGVDTRIVVWSTGGQAYYRDGAGNKVKYFHTVNIYDDKQNRKSVNFDLTGDELDWFDPETIVGRPADFTDGFIEWTPNASIPTSSATRITSVFSYSVISAATFGATQTILNPHTR
ncbi:MAG TPA: hypothetical protein PKI22_10345, partial [Hydrogenophilus thermoluteolus]|nr:hypothetical protein [Hydrogenophilus thermoluteolus]